MRLVEGSVQRAPAGGVAVKARQNMDQEKKEVSREKIIIRTSVIGIVANVFLAAFKAAVGIVANSIAVTLDAVNNLSDAMSSVITIIGTKLSGRAPDRKHPLGYGRTEYLSSMIVSAIVLYAGITSLTESVKKIVHPEPADYSAVALIILASAVAVKLLLGRYVTGVGKKVNSGSLVASGSDAGFDAILSLSVLASAVLYLTTGISVEAWVGVVIAVIIIKSGIGMMRETVSQILGERPDCAMVNAIKADIRAEEGVHGAYDLVLHDYGPERKIGSVHIEVPDTMTADEIDALERRIQHDILVKHGVILTGIGIYSMNTKNDAAAKIRDDVRSTAMAHDYVLQFHGFYVNMEAKQMSFDTVLSFDVSPEDAVRELTGEILAKYPGYSLQITPDVDLSGTYDEKKG